MSHDVLKYCHKHYCDCLRMETADLQRDTTSRKENTLSSSSLGSSELMGASGLEPEEASEVSGSSENIWDSFQPTLLLLGGNKHC